jgi:tRNA-specific 2-thiouridylase
VGKVDFAEFLKAHIPAEKWPIVDTTGKILGEHDGAFQYTIWQRKGIGVGGGPALYVVEKNVETNTIIAWQEDDPRLLSTTCTIGELNWLEDVVLPLSCEAQIRYRQAPQKCSLIMKNEQWKTNNVQVVFEVPQRAITPGQVCVFYDDDTVLGSGIIMS